MEEESIFAAVRRYTDVSQHDADIFPATEQVWQELGVQLSGADGQVDVEAAEQFGQHMVGFIQRQIEVAPEPQQQLLQARLKAVQNAMEPPLLANDTGYQQKQEKWNRVFPDFLAGPGERDGDQEPRPGDAPPEHDEGGPDPTPPSNTGMDPGEAAQPPGPPAPPAPSALPSPGDEPPERLPLDEATRRWYQAIQPYAMPSDYQVPSEASQIAASFDRDYLHPDTAIKPVVPNPAAAAKAGAELALRHADEIAASMGKTSRSREHPRVSEGETVLDLSVTQTNHAVDQIDQHGPQLLGVLRTLRGSILPALAPHEWHGNEPIAGTRTETALVAIDGVLKRLDEVPSEPEERPSAAPHPHIKRLSNELTADEQENLAKAWGGVSLGLEQHLAPVRHLATQVQGGDPTGEEVAQAAQSLSRFEAVSLEDSRTFTLVRTTKLIPTLLDRQREPGLPDTGARLVFVPERLLSSSDPTAEQSITAQQHMAVTAVEWVKGLADERYKAASEIPRNYLEDPETADRLDDTTSMIANARQALIEVGRALENSDSGPSLAAAWQPLRDYNRGLFDVDLAGDDPRNHAVEFQLSNSDPVDVTRELLRAYHKLDVDSEAAALTRAEIASLLTRAVAATGTTLVAAQPHLDELSPEQRAALDFFVDAYLPQLEETLVCLQDQEPLAHHPDPELNKLRELISYHSEHLNRAPMLELGMNDVRAQMIVDHARYRTGYIDSWRGHARPDVRSREEIEASPSGTPLAGEPNQETVLHSARMIRDLLATLSQRNVIQLLSDQNADRAWDATESLAAWSAELTEVIDLHENWMHTGEPSGWDEISEKWTAVLDRSRYRQALAPMDALLLPLQNFSPDGLEAAYGGHARFLRTTTMATSSGRYPPGQVEQYRAAADAEYEPLVYQSDRGATVALVPKRTVTPDVSPDYFISGGLELAIHVVDEAYVHYEHERYGLRHNVGAETIHAQAPELEDHARVSAAYDRNLAAKNVLSEISKNPVPAAFEQLRAHNDRLCRTSFDAMVEQGVRVDANNVTDVAERRVITELPQPIQAAAQLSDALDNMFDASVECGQRNAPNILATAVPLAAAAGQALVDQPGDRGAERLFATVAGKLLARIDGIDPTELANELGPDRSARLGLIIEVLRYQHERFRDSGGSSGNTIGRGPWGPGTPGRNDPWPSWPGYPDSLKPPHTQRPH